MEREFLIIKVSKIAKDAWDNWQGRKGISEALEIAEQAWIGREEVNDMSVETLVSVDEAVRAVARQPFAGQVGEKVYVSKRPTADGLGQIVGLTAVWEGAARLAGDDAVRCVVLTSNPERWDLGSAISLTVSRGKGELIEVNYRPGETFQLDPRRARLVNTILGNIARGL